MTHIAFIATTLALIALPSAKADEQVPPPSLFERDESGYGFYSTQDGLEPVFRLRGGDSPRFWHTQPEAPHLRVVDHLSTHDPVFYPSSWPRADRANEVQKTDHLERINTAVENWWAKHFKNAVLRSFDTHCLKILLFFMAAVSASCAMTLLCVDRGCYKSLADQPPAEMRLRSGSNSERQSFLSASEINALNYNSSGSDKDQSSSDDEEQEDEHMFAALERGWAESPDLQDSLYTRRLSKEIPQLNVQSLV